MTLSSNSNPGLRAPWIPDTEVAALLHVHQSTVRRWLDQGLIP
jgi:hypothetical protein